MLMYDRNQTNIVNQLSINLKKKKAKLEFWICLSIHLSHTEQISLLHWVSESSPVMPAKCIQYFLKTFSIFKIRQIQKASC